jgi:hypothetical protein
MRIHADLYPDPDHGQTLPSQKVDYDILKGFFVTLTVVSFLFPGSGPGSAFAMRDPDPDLGGSKSMPILADPETLNIPYR